MHTTKLATTIAVAARVVRPRLLAPLMLLAGTVVLAVGSAQATPGALDPSFGAGGTLTTSFGPKADVAYAIALQPDGKVVAAGFGFDTKYEFALARYNSDGSLDTSFNGTGKVTTSLGSGADQAFAVALQPDGKIVAAGTSYNGSDYDFALTRYNADGSLDTSFNGSGKVTTPVGPGDDFVDAVAVQPDGKIVVTGESDDGSNADFALTRYNANGSLDTSFNGTGKVTTSLGSGEDFAQALALQPDGRIVAAGSSYDGSTYDFALARYNADGSLDAGFGTGGAVTTPFGPASDIAEALALQPDGRIVAAGYSSNGSKYDFALARYNQNGSLDAGFGTGGKTTTSIDSHSDFAHAVALQPDGRIIVAGQSYQGVGFALARYNANGSIDVGFGTGGTVTTSIGSGAVAHAVRVQPDGRIVAAGSSDNGSSEDFALARYLGSTLAVTKTGTGAGSVTSAPVGIDCGATCSAPFADVPITLTVVPAAGSRFAGWAGDGCSGTGTCIVRTDADKSVSASFVALRALTVTNAGSGSGAVASMPAGIDCGATCTARYDHGTSVTLTATAAAGSSFTGWSGDCTGSTACTVTLDTDKTTTATFEPDKTLTVAQAGAGTIVSSPGGIACGATCSHAYTHGASVTLTASAQAKSVFKGWSGDCSGTGPCTLTMNAAHSATATFQPLCVVPKVKGKTLAAAKTAIKNAHCSVGTVTKAFSSNVKKGRVIAENPKAGVQRPQGSKVKLQNSKGKKT